MLSLANLGNPYQRALTLANVCNLHQMAGNADPVARYARLLAEHAQRSGLPAWLDIADFLLGWQAAEQGERAKGIDAMRATRIVSGALASEQEQPRIETPFTLGLFAAQLLLDGRVSEALEVIARARAAGERTGECWYKAELLRLESRCLRARDGVTEPVLALLEEAGALAQEQSAACWQLRASLDLTDCHAAAGATRRSREVLERCRVRIGADVDARELDELERRLNGGPGTQR